LLANGDELNLNVLKFARPLYFFFFFICLFGRSVNVLAEKKRKWGKFLTEPIRGSKILLRFGVWLEIFSPLSEILFLPLEHKIHIFSPPCNILYLAAYMKMFLKNRGNEIISY